jgi:hypothetical protein
MMRLLFWLVQRGLALPLPALEENLAALAAALEEFAELKAHHSEAFLVQEVCRRVVQE